VKQARGILVKFIGDADHPESQETTMTDDMAAISILFAISATANIALVVALFRAARRNTKLESRVPVEHTDRRIAQLEEAVDAIGAQVDQLASGQEFLNRMVANERERAPRRLPEPPREITPH
jgi:hypothetical protein